MVSLKNTRQRKRKMYVFCSSLFFHYYIYSYTRARASIIKKNTCFFNFFIWRLKEYYIILFLAVYFRKFFFMDVSFRDVKIKVEIIRPTLQNIYRKQRGLSDKSLENVLTFVLVIFINTNECYVFFKQVNLFCFAF